MFKRPRTSQHPDQLAATGFTENHPFTVFVELGWTVHRASEPHTRRRWAGPVRTVILEHPDHGHVCIFDIDKRGRMRDYATYTIDNHTQSHSYFAHTPDAAAELARQAPAALAALPNVQQLT